MGTFESEKKSYLDLRAHYVKHGIPEDVLLIADEFAERAMWSSDSLGMITAREIIEFHYIKNHSKFELINKEIN